MAEEGLNPSAVNEGEQEETKPIGVSSVTLLSNNPLGCNMCGKIFASRRLLLVHQWTHKERQSFYCPHCEKNFNNENQFKRHMHVHTKEGKKYVSCDICKKYFRNNRVLEEHHVKDHAGQKPYRCGTCGIQFSWRENLRKHLQTHIDKPFACLICHESFKDTYALEVHGRIHKREMKELEKREIERKEQEEREKRRELHKQMGVFTVGGEIDIKPKIDEADDEDKLFKCAVCCQSFKYTFTLEAHMKGHVDEGIDIKKDEDDDKPAVITTVVPATLMKSTTSSNPVFAKPFECEICHQTFRWDFCLEAHLKIHKQGYDAKLEKEKERKLLKKAKEIRRQESLKRGTEQTNENGKEKQEGTVVIVMEELAEKEKAKAANRKPRKTPQRKKQTQSKPTKRRQTRREAMAEEVLKNEPLSQNTDDEEEEDDDDEINQTITFEFADEDADSPCADKANCETENAQCSAPKVPKLENESSTQTLSVIPQPSSSLRGKAKTRGGAHVNHIDLGEVVASIGQETRKSLTIKRGVSTRGGKSRGAFNDRGYYQAHTEYKKDSSNYGHDIKSSNVDGDEKPKLRELEHGEIPLGDEHFEEENEYKEEEEEDGEEEDMDEVENEQGDEEEGSDMEPNEEEEIDDESIEGSEQQSEEDDNHSDTSHSEHRESDHEDPEDADDEEMASGNEEETNDRDKSDDEQMDSSKNSHNEDQSSAEEGEVGGYLDEDGNDISSDEGVSKEGEEEESNGEKNIDEDEESRNYEENTKRSLNKHTKDINVDEEEEDEDEDDEDEVLNDDLDEQELLKLKMKVYSCELCSKAFVEHNLLMEHKINYHQQNGDGRNILFSNSTKPRSHTKVLPASNNKSNFSRGNR